MNLHLITFMMSAENRLKMQPLKYLHTEESSGQKWVWLPTEAGISQDLSYRYFKSKEEIFTLLVKEAMEEAQATLENVRNFPAVRKTSIQSPNGRMLHAQPVDITPGWGSS